MGIIEDITKDMIRSDIPDFWVGDTVKVHQKIKEGNKELVFKKEEIPLFEKLKNIEL